MNKFKKYMFTRAVKKEVVQGDHERKITAMYRVISEEAKKVFTEDPPAVLNQFLTDCHKEAMKEIPFKNTTVDGVGT